MWKREGCKGFEVYEGEKVDHRIYTECGGSDVWGMRGAERVFGSLNC